MKNITVFFILIIAILLTSCNKQKKADIHFEQGSTYYKKGLYNEAIEEYTKAIKLNSKFAEAYNQRGIAYYKKGETDKAIKDFSKAIELNPKYKHAYNNRGIVLENKTLYTDAIKDYTTFVQLAKDDTTFNKNVLQVKERIKKLIEINKKSQKPGVLE